MAVKLLGYKLKNLAFPPKMLPARKYRTTGVRNGSPLGSCRLMYRLFRPLVTASLSQSSAIKVKGMFTSSANSSPASSMSSSSS